MRSSRGGIAAVLVGCATTYVPQQRNQGAMVLKGGSPAMQRDGQVYELGIFSDEARGKTAVEVGSLGLFAAGLESSSDAHLLDAVNLYNDAVAAPAAIALPPAR
jgi:hypothetical protein